MKWFIYTRGSIPPYRTDLFLQGFRNNYAKAEDYKYFKLLMSNEGNKLWFAYETKKANFFGGILIKKLTNKNSFKKHCNKVESLSRESIKLSKEVEKKNLKLLSNKEFSNLFKKTWKFFVLTNSYLALDIDVFDIVFDKFLYQEFRKEFSGSSKEGQDIFQQISTSACKTYVQKEETALLKVALKNKISEEDIKNLYKHFWWTSLGWESIIPKTEKYFENEIKELRKKSKEELRKNLNHLDGHIDKIKDNRRKLLVKYGLSEKFAHSLKVVDEYTYLHDLRKETQVRNIHTIYFLLKEIAKRTQNKIEDLEWLWADEALEILNGKKLDKELIKKRKECYFVFVDNKKIREILGEKGIALRKKELEIKLNNSGVIKGQIAQKGKIKGIAKVCNGAEDALRKIKKGDILVCGMTLPDYVPAMKKSAAIITDEGGVTCHAAIISRELKIPRIIGTKIATQVLKDGDKVEVDANKGIVKILKKK